MFYAEAQKRERRQLADQLRAVNAGTAGGKHARELLNALTKDD